MGTPPLGKSIAIGIRAAGNQGGLLSVAVLISLVRSLTALPALAVGAALALEGAATAARHRPLSFTAPMEGAVAVVTSPRFVALVFGLLLAGTLVSGLLRVVFLAGAFPTLAARVARIDATRRFAPGVLWGTPRQLATWLLAGLVELGAAGYLLVAGVAIVRVGGGGSGVSPIVLAGAAAAALGVGVLGVVVSRVLGDVAAARAAILDEGPAGAYAGAVRRFLDRPGAFVLAGLGVALSGLAIAAALQSLAGGIEVLGGQVHEAILLGPRLMLALLAVFGAAAVDLAWLGTVTVLACAEEGEPAPQPARDVSA